MTIDQGEWESCALWLKVAKGIRESNFRDAVREKTPTKVYIFLSYSLYLIFPLLIPFFIRFDKQNGQCKRRRDEAAEGTTWELKHFVHQDDDLLCRSFFFSVSACLMSRSQTTGRIRPSE